mmetsp:Transcript_20627/g.58907  ORF Transcript_20627/g.58907 Transcript_20627/m.58907 type:complete len:259 (-) Transcript_20627:1775-2551(-)
MRQVARVTSCAGKGGNRQGAQATGEIGKARGWHAGSTCSTFGGGESTAGMLNKPVHVLTKGCRCVRSEPSSGSSGNGSSSPMATSSTSSPSAPNGSNEGAPGNAGGTSSVALSWQRFAPCSSGAPRRKRRAAPGMAMALPPSAGQPSKYCVQRASSEASCKLPAPTAARKVRRRRRLARNVAQRRRAATSATTPSGSAPATLCESASNRRYSVRIPWNASHVACSGVIGGRTRSMSSICTGPSMPMFNTSDTACLATS